MTRRGKPPSASEFERERLLVRELLAAHRQLNQSHFKRTLSTPQISIGDASTFLARYLRGLATIEFSRSFLHSTSWGIVVEVLKHEMAHQYVHEVLGEADESPHGPAFRATCARLGIDERASGLPEPATSPDVERMMARVHKLLALAESDNRHEAEAAALAAQRLMLRHNLSVSADGSAAPRYAFRHLGRVTGRVSEWERRLGNILREHFFVDVIWVPALDPDRLARGSVMEAIGSRENLDIAAYVYDFLIRTGEHAWALHKTKHGLRGNTDRRSFLSGVMSGFAQKLEQQAELHQSEGLVWVPEAGLASYTRKRHPYLRTVSHRGPMRRDVFAHGQKAGRELVLHRGITAQNQRSEPRRLRG